MGITLKDRGKLEEAIEAFNKTLSIKPDYVDAYNNTTELLKIYSQKPENSHIIFSIDSKIKKLSSRLVSAKSDQEIIESLIEGLDYIGTDSNNFKTSLSQIYKRNTVEIGRAHV